MSAPALTLKHQKPQGYTGFSALDIVGVSLSTLLFTIVWVSLFSILLPQRSEMVFSEGLEKLSSVSAANRFTLSDTHVGNSLTSFGRALNTLSAENLNSYGMVLGLSTQSLSSLSQGLIGYTVDYLNLLTFGLLDDAYAGVLNISPVTSALENSLLVKSG